MSIFINRDHPARRRRKSREFLAVEIMELRTLPSSTALAIPLGHLGARAVGHADVARSTPPATIFANQITAFQSQLQAGPLQGLENGITQAIANFRAAYSGSPELTFTYGVSPPAAQVTAAQPAIIAMDQAISSASGRFLSGVRSTASQFIATVNSQVKPVAPRIARLLRLQAGALVTTETQSADREAAGVYAEQDSIFPTTIQGTTYWGLNPSDWPYFYLKDSWTTITQLTQSRPLWPQGTPTLALYERADIFRHALTFDITGMLSLLSSGQAAFNSSSLATHPYVVAPGETPQAFVAQAQNLAIAEAEAFRADDNATLTQQPSWQRMANRVVNQVEGDLAKISLSTGDPAAQSAAATATFNAQLMSGRGLFGPQGPLGKTFRPPTNPFPDTPGDFARLYTYTNARVTKTTVTAADMTVSYNGTNYAVFHRVNSDPPSAPPLPPYNPANPAAYLAALQVFKEDNFFGSYVSTQAFSSSSQAIAGNALDQSWFHPNRATQQVYALVPAGTVVYQGTVAPIYQGLLKREKVPSKYPGGGQQTVILNSRAQDVIFITSPTVVTNLQTGAQETLAIQQLPT